MSGIPNYNFARLAKAARREEYTRRVVYGKQVAAGTMKSEVADKIIQDMEQMAEILEHLTLRKLEKATKHDA